MLDKADYLDTDNKYAVRRFLRRQINALGIEDSLKIKVTSNTDRFEVKVLASYDKDALPLEVLYLGMDDVDGNPLELGALQSSVYYAKRGIRGLGALGVQVALAVAYARGDNEIRLRTVHTDGLSFWPHFGSLPEHYFLKPSYFDDFLFVYKGEYSQETEAELLRIRDLTYHYKYRAWRELALSPAQLNDKSLARRFIFRQVPWGGSHIILPAEPQTQKMLRDRMGVILPFRSVPKRYAPILHELGQPPNTAAQALSL